MVKVTLQICFKSLAFDGFYVLKDKSELQAERREVLAECEDGSEPATLTGFFQALVSLSLPVLEPFFPPEADGLAGL